MRGVSIYVRRGEAVGLLGPNGAGKTTVFYMITGLIKADRGTIELDVEEKVPDTNAMIICHCGGGGRSALAAESLQKMGYKNVRSMAGGFKAWKSVGLPTAK